MKLQRLAGFGPTAAFVSAASMLVWFVLEEAGNSIVAAAPGLLVPTVIVMTLAQFLWIAGLAVVVFDLEWLEHPATSTSRIRIAQVATLVALLMPIPIAIAPFTLGLALQAPAFFLLFAGVATTVLVHMFEGRRARLLHGALPWFGIVIGVLYALCAVGYIGILLPGIGMSVFMGGFDTNLFTEVLYIVWATWMGVDLVRSKTPARVAAATA